SIGNALSRRNLPGSTVPCRCIHSFLKTLIATMRVFLASTAAFVGMLLTIPVAAIWLLFWVVGFLTKLGPRLFEPHVVPSDQLIEFAPTIGWKPKANLDAYFLTMVRD